MADGDRWITVCPPEQPAFEIILSPVNKSIFSKEKVKALKELVERWNFLALAFFTCHDILRTYEELKAKGVSFTKTAKKRILTAPKQYLKDDSGKLVFARATCLKNILFELIYINENDIDKTTRDQLIQKNRYA